MVIVSFNLSKSKYYKSGYKSVLTDEETWRVPFKDVTTHTIKSIIISIKDNE